MFARSCELLRSYPRLAHGVARLAPRPSTAAAGSLIKRNASVQQASPVSHEDSWGAGWDNYKVFLQRRSKVVESCLNSPTRFQKISEREDRSDVPPEAIQAHYMGKYFITHRGCQLLKSTNDMTILQQLFWELRPATVIELGTFTGGSAVWMADMLRLMDIKSHIFSMDVDPSLIEEEVKRLQPDNVTFLKGDSNAIEKTFTEEFLGSLAHPWLVIEDAHTNLYGVLKYFTQFMEAGDYLVVEDLNPDLPGQLGFGRIYPELKYKRAGTMGLEYLNRFLSDHNQEFSVDSYYTDMFGYNGTHNWHGYIRRM